VMCTKDTTKLLEIARLFWVALHFTLRWWDRKYHSLLYNLGQTLA